MLKIQNMCGSSSHLIIKVSSLFIFDVSHYVRNMTGSSSNQKWVAMFQLFQPIVVPRASRSSWSYRREGLGNETGGTRDGSEYAHLLWKVILTMNVKTMKLQGFFQLTRVCSEPCYKNHVSQIRYCTMSFSSTPTRDK